MGVLIERLKARARSARGASIPRVLANVVRPRPFKERVKRITEAFPQRFWFYNPVQCPKGVVRRPRMVGRTEIYTCPNGTTRKFRRSRTPSEFFKRRYGRGGEFAQGLYAVLRKLGYDVRLVLGYWRGANALWVEIRHAGRWIPLDPAAKHGYGRKFPKPGMKVVAYSNSGLVNRTKFYKVTRSTLTDGGY